MWRSNNLIMLTQFFKTMRNNRIPCSCARLRSLLKLIGRMIAVLTDKRVGVCGGEVLSKKLDLKTIIREEMIRNCCFSYENLAQYSTWPNFYQKMNGRNRSNST